MPNCAILSCKNSTKNVGRNNGNVSFHRFPNDPSIKEKWIDATGQKNWFPTKFSSICSIHFNDGSFAETNKNRRLNTDAIPTIDGYFNRYTLYCTQTNRQITYIKTKHIPYISLSISRLENATIK
ncbi:hypothetical protein ABMA27_009613 [Loxostege sticticalis]|uniref:THAP-type domain-containing protein n=1 Tax=Loxostege sticticalis TaxID=481309 RepID=A0ABR3H8J4_LOXSC